MIDSYLFILLLGFGGLALMALLGLGHQHAHGGSHATGAAANHGGHGGHHGAAGSVANAGHHAGGHGAASSGHVAAQHHGCGGQGHAHGHSHSHSHSNGLGGNHGNGGSHAMRGAHPSASNGGGNGSNGLMAALALLSPRVAFTLLMGFGATGVLLRPLAPTAWVLFVLAASGAAAFEWLVVSRFWKFLFRFASDPARTLDSSVLEEGQAVTNFDGAGHGLISLHLDGQLRQVLGTLCPEDRAEGRRVRAGDRLFIRAVDARRNACTVSLLR